MNERYLFKAKRIDNGEWVQGHLIVIEKENCFICTGKIKLDAAIKDFIAPEMYKVFEDTICQCADFKDKNGKLIWENDIVEIGEHKDTVNGLYKVIYCENAHCYALERSVGFHYNFFTFSDSNGFETSSKFIGNIFDNPELLESEV